MGEPKMIKSKLNEKKEAIYKGFVFATFNDSEHILLPANINSLIVDDEGNQYVLRGFKEQDESDDYVIFYQVNCVEEGPRFVHFYVGQNEEVIIKDESVAL